MKWNLTRGDLLFLIDTLMPDYRDRERAVALIEGDERAIEVMLNDERLFQRLVSDDEVLVRVSPWLFFTVLLRRARRDLGEAAYTIEQRNQQKVFLFDADRVAGLLAQEPLRDYLAAMLASFTHVESVTVPVRVRKGVWHKYRISDLDVESLVRLGAAVAEESRFETYRRIADACLFLTGMFPDFVDAQHRYPLSGQPRLRSRTHFLRSREDYEGHGQEFYRLAAEHDRAKAAGMSEVLATLSEQFVLAEKPLAFLAEHYLRFTRYRVFDVS